jgi:hypothetical protein
MEMGSELLKVIRLYLGPMFTPEPMGSDQIKGIIVNIYFNKMVMSRN